MLKIVTRRVEPDRFHGEMLAKSMLASENSLRLLCVTNGEWDVIRRRERRHMDRLASSCQL
ncbi:hypothetical protein PanWU01x14_109360 [Parasponia andersonii]|uniref:Uncharacterized protein n=1 Tax=Parasponia andersonii TaxID=3476 RepID=A0A2P5CZP5_PARAD|nr:hypothetical protein PanWU01x14_109360 [Parasponia andersonii]